MKHRDPWFKFYPSDWLRDTRHMSLEQRGAYIDMIAIQMQFGEALNDDYKWLSHQLHVSARKARSIVESLIDLTVIQRTPEGLTNKRAENELLSRSVQRRAKSEAAVKRERKRRETSEKLNKNNYDPTTEGHNIKSTESEIDKNKTLGQTTLFDQVKEAVEKLPKAKPKPKATDKQFAEFWEHYPRRVKKAEARKKFLALSPDDGELATKGARAYAAEVARDGRDKSKILHPTTYLNQRVFEDLLDEAEETPSDVIDGKRWGWWRGREEKLRNLPAEQWRRTLDAANPNGRWPWEKLGAPPGHPECVVNPTVVAERHLDEIYHGKIEHD